MTVRSMVGLEKLSYVTSHIISCFPARTHTRDSALEHYKHLPLPTGTSSPAQTLQLPLSPG